MFNLRAYAQKKGLRIVHCKGILSKAIGFMFSKPNKILVFEFNREKIQSIHMMFVFFPLTVVFLNEREEVVETATLNPFSFYTSKNRAKLFIEIPYKIRLKEKEKVLLN